MILKKLFGNNKSLSTPEETVGEVCIVVERVDTAAGCGEVRVGGGVWAARGTFEDDTFEVGEKLRVVAVEGVRLICRR